MENNLFNKEPRYNLSYVLKETGIKADTLRAWERRYQLPQPHRTEGGHRLFSEFDIQIVKWLLEKQSNGMSISKAVSLWKEIMDSGSDPMFNESAKPPSFSKTIDDLSQTKGITEIRNAWVHACLNFDELNAESLLSQSFAQFSIETVCIDILQSGLSIIGDLWQKGEASVQQEHFASELASRRLYTLIASSPIPMRDKTILIGCPEGEDHAFMALLLTVLLRQRGINVIFLGANVPNEHLKETTDKTKAVLVIMTAMRLTNAASLQKSALMLQEIGIPLSFGGWVFNQIPGLHEYISGQYLGTDLHAAIGKVEEQLARKFVRNEIEPKESPFLHTIAHFEDKKQQIGKQTLEIIQNQSGGNLPIGQLRDANDYLAKDISAALYLGDLSLASPNLDWVKSLIPQKEILLSSYLIAYLQAARDHLNNSGRPIIEWLTSLVQMRSK